VHPEDATFRAKIIPHSRIATRRASKEKRESFPRGRSRDPIFRIPSSRRLLLRAAHVRIIATRYRAWESDDSENGYDNDRDLFPIVKRNVRVILRALSFRLIVDHYRDRRSRITLAFRYDNRLPVLIILVFVYVIMSFLFSRGKTSSRSPMTFDISRASMKR